MGSIDLEMIQSSLMMVTISFQHFHQGIQEGLQLKSQQERKSQAHQSWLEIPQTYFFMIQLRHQLILIHKGIMDRMNQKQT